ncbi:MAG: hypothetical protein AABY22_01015 [Nanoarchaeota archaeon]
MDDYQEGNSQIKIANREMSVYHGAIIAALQTKDEIELSAVEIYLDKMLLIANMWEAVGVVIHKQHKKFNGKLNIFKEIKNVKNMRTGRMENISINKLTLIKIEDLFRFTFPDKKIELEKKELS